MVRSSQRFLFRDGPDCLGMGNSAYTQVAIHERLSKFEGKMALFAGFKGYFDGLGGAFKFSCSLKTGYP